MVTTQPTEMLVDLARLEREYYERWPDLDDPEQPRRVAWPSHSPVNLDVVDVYDVVDVVILQNYFLARDQRLRAGCIEGVE